MTRYPFSCGFVFSVEIFSPALFRSSMKRSWVNFFFSPVTTIVDCGLLTLFISARVSAGFGMFCRRVMPKTWSKVWFWKGV